MALFSRLFKKNKVRAKGKWLYEQALAASRRVSLYKAGGVPDTVDGRFDLLVIHVWMLIRRLNALEAHPLGQEVFDAMFNDMDNALRELGISDTAVGKRIKDMAKVFYGRTELYNAAQERGDAEALAVTLERNIFSDMENKGPLGQAMAAHMQAIENAMSAQALENILENGPCYPAFA
ncbi:MAG: ubiquinol-cytochrome C chaperone [Robiginitomaculum sp.]|nr:MAG: ubiquinol-cytochrome C chaperone [Robiginitomaculum sp.]